jgi:hypothetical protein
VDRMALELKRGVDVHRHEQSPSGQFP